YEPADPHLLRAARERMRGGAFASAGELLTMRARALSALGVEPGDARCLEGDVLHAEVCARSGALETAHELVGRVEAAPRAGVRVRADAARVRGMVAHKRGERDAHEHFRRAHALYAQLGDREHVGESLHGIAECSKLTGALAE